MVNVNPRNTPPTPGDRIPDLLLAAADGSLVSMYDKSCGKPLVVAITNDAQSVVAAFSAALTGNGAPDLDIFVVGGPAPGSPASSGSAGENDIHVLHDPQQQAPRAFGFDWSDVSGDARLFLLDENQRLLAQFSADAERAVAVCLKYASELQPDVEAGRPRRIAPVLMIPRVFEPQFCRDLIDAFHVRGHEESGVYSLEGGEPRHAVDHSMKKRFDHYVRDDDLTAEISRRMARRVLPEIEKAFWYRVTKLEEFKIACYRASERGYFRAHRDNYSPQTVHRRFAMTLNLNADEYQGGELRFPEYGPHLYKPSTGEAIIFSCSMLHEALDVTEGERYVLLAFLYGEDGARQKAEMARRMARAGGR